MELDYNKIKRDFRVNFSNVLDENILLKHLLYEIFVIGSAYIVGGFLRDLINKKQSRDIDIIVDISHSHLLDFVSSSGIIHDINRHKGIKLQFDSLQVDIWSMENNWAFKNELVKPNDDNLLDSIAKGCFYNYDALVINLHTNNLNIKYYNDFIEKKQLDILQQNPKYKILNPTVEANILRAFFLRKFFNISYSSNAKMYLNKTIGKIRDAKGDPHVILKETKLKYPKYQILTDQEISKFIDEIILDSEIDNQMLFNF